MKIENEFVDYNTALALKKLGFDEECLGYYLCRNSAFGIDDLEITTDYIDLLPYDSSSCKAPTFSQVFKWFREKYNLDSSIALVANGYGFYIHKNRNYTNKGENYGMYITYKEAELECLKKLIEIINESKKD